MSGFLTASEILMMKNDFKILLASPEATDVTITYKVPTSPVVEPAYGTVDTSGWITKTKKSKCIQQMINPRDEKLLSFGILEVGDCILHLPTSLDLSVDNYDSMVITIVGVEWVPVPRNREQFYNYLIVRLGQGQLAQVIACKLKH